MRVAFFASGDFAVPSLHAVVGAGHEVVLLVTQPARPAGRSGKPRPTPIARVGLELGLSPWQCPDVNAPQALETIAASGPDVIVVADFGQFIRQRVCKLAPLEAFNLHGSLLPALRGAAPVNWAIINGLERTGVTTFRLVDKMDAGPVYLQSTTEIKPLETAEELEVRLARLGADLLCRTLDLLALGPQQGIVQDESQVSFAPRLKKSDGIINWSAPAERIKNLIHGCWSWPGGQCDFYRQDGSRVPVIIARVDLADQTGCECKEPGLLDNDLKVCTGLGRLGVLELKPSGKRQMSWRDFVNGYRVKCGDRFCRPQEQADDISGT